MKIQRNPHVPIGDQQMPQDIKAIATLAVLFVLNALFILALVTT